MGTQKRKIDLKIGEFRLGFFFPFSSLDEDEKRGHRTLAPKRSGRKKEGGFGLAQKCNGAMNACSRASLRKKKQFRRVRLLKGNSNEREKKWRRLKIGNARQTHSKKQSLKLRQRMGLSEAWKRGGGGGGWFGDRERERQRKRERRGRNKKANFVPLHCPFAHENAEKKIT